MSRLSAAAGLLIAVLFGASLASSCAAGRGSDGQEGGNNGSGGVSFDGGTGTNTGIDSDAACATASDEAKNVPVNMYIMFDKSFSMLDKWSQTTSALQNFFMDPASAGLRIALRFFPDEGCDNNCSVAGCSQPKVPLGELTNLSAPTDAHEQALLDAFIDVEPAGGTPMSAALDGALLWAQGVLMNAPEEKAVVLLVTDGEPTDCNEDDNYLIAAAGSAYDNRGIITFAIGLEGSAESLLNGIAHAGGSKKAIFVGNEKAKEELTAALNAIRETSIACEFQMPTGNMVDPGKINVVYTPGDGSGAITIGQVPSVAECGAKAAWYYDNPVNPTKITLCPETCSSIQADEQAKLDILVGCGTIPA